LSVYEESLLKKGQEIGKTDSLDLYELPVEALFHNTSQKIIDDFYRKKDSLFVSNEYYFSEPEAFLYFNDFEGHPNDITFRGTGAFQGNKRDHLTIAEFNPGTFVADKIYTVSAWMFNGRQDALNFWFRFRIEEFNPTTKTWNVIHTLPEESQVINGDWSLVELNFMVSQPENYIYLRTIGKTIDHQIFVLDDLLVREKQTDIYSIGIRDFDGNKELFMNNHRIPLSE